MTGSNEDLTFAPYHISYKAAEDDLQRAGLFPEPNVWDSPFVAEKNSENCWTLMEAKDFYHFALPFEIELDKNRRKLFFKLPPLYEEAVTEKDTVQKHWKAKTKVTKNHFLSHLRPNTKTHVPTHSASK